MPLNEHCGFCRPCLKLSLFIFQHDAADLHTDSEHAPSVHKAIKGLRMCSTHAHYKEDADLTIVCCIWLNKKKQSKKEYGADLFNENEYLTR